MPIGKIEQDYLRRIVLRERDADQGVAVHLIAQTARFALEHGFHVILEGILVAHRYGSMITSLLRDNRGESFVYYLDVSLPETLRRHTLRPQAAEFTGEDMQGWYLPRDVLGCDGEYGEESSFDETLTLIEATAGLTTARADTVPQQGRMGALP
ncbi:kinase [Micromonospora sp. NPDC004704]